MAGTNKHNNTRELKLKAKIQKLELEAKEYKKKLMERKKALTKADNDVTKLTGKNKTLTKQINNLKIKASKEGEATPNELADDHLWSFLNDRGIFDNPSMNKIKAEKRSIPSRTIYSTQNDKPSVYTYKDGVWTERAKNYFDNQLGTIRGDIEGEAIPLSVRRYAIKQAQNRTQMLDVDIEKKKFDNRYFIVTNNKTIDLDNNNAVLDHDPKYFSHTKLDIDYDPNATCPKFEKLIFETLGSQQSEMFYELLAYCIYKDTPIPAIHFLLGEGGNGKGTLIGIMEHMLGLQNVSHIPLAVLVDRNKNQFRIHELKDKLLNVAGDSDKDPLKDTGILKTLTGADIVNSDRKNTESTSFRASSKYVFSFNELPANYDKSQGMRDRIVLIRFNNRYRGQTGERTKADILEDVESEKSGIFNLMLSKLTELLARGQFIKGDRLVELFLQDPIEAFCELFTFEGNFGQQQLEAEDVSGNNMFLLTLSVQKAYAELFELAGKPVYRTPIPTAKWNKIIADRYGVKHERCTPTDMRTGDYFKGMGLDMDMFEELKSSIKYHDSPIR